MADNRSLDGLELSSLNLPYNRILRELDDTPRLVDGHDTYVTLGGKLIKRPGTFIIPDTEFSLRIDRLWFYETLDTPAYTYVIASCFDTSVWKLYYIRLDAASPAWTAVSSLRQCNASERPHEAVVSRGLMYIKGYPSNASAERLGTIIFDGTGGTVSTKVWGALGPTTPARISGLVKHLSATIDSDDTAFTFDNVTSLPATPFNVQIDFEVITVVTLVGSTATVVLRAAQGTVASAHDANAPIIYRDWTASNHPVAVNMFWGYTYAYKTITGHLTNRAAVETNPDNLPSYTGPFTNLIPKLTVQGLADTTNFPTIVIYRTTDGGGTYMKLDEITNTGGGSITYFDNSRTSTAGDLDPIADKDLNSQELAPSLNSNSPPPAVLAPLVTGVAQPAASTPLIAWQGRIWLAIGNTLFYSANEELSVGIPEESWPTGQFGNFFRYNNPITNLEATSNTLYVVTSSVVHEITGSTKQTFSSRPVVKNVGGASGQPRAITTYGDTLVWLTNDYRIAILQGSNFRTISEPLGTDYIDTLTSPSIKIDLKYWAYTDKEWITVTSISTADTTLNRVWIYDIKKSIETRSDFWNTPWALPCTAVAVGKIKETNILNLLVFSMWNSSVGGCQLNQLSTETDEILGTDDLTFTFGISITTPFGYSFTTNLFQTVTGNHINTLRKPELVPVVYSFIIDRTTFDADIDPDLFYYSNDIFTTPIPTLPPAIPARDDEPLGYRTMIYGIQKKAKRIGIKVSLQPSPTRAEIQNISIIWNGDKGAGL